ncbi:MAG: hypothetical protein K6D57_04430 [Paludibacteraceae bacterium]|nr:hypothetical protein [Paludibacteraceae bacterium]
MLSTLLGWIVVAFAFVCLVLIHLALFYYLIFAPVLFIISKFTKNVKNPYKDLFKGFSGSMPNDITRIMGPF